MIYEFILFLNRENKKQFILNHWSLGLRLSEHEFSNLFVDAQHAGGHRHVHEFRFSVHLESALNVLIDLVLNSESLALVLRVSLKSLEDLTLLGLRQLLGRDNSNFLLLVELLVKLLVLASNILNVDKALVLSQNSKEVHSGIVERSNLLKGIVKLTNFLESNTAVLGKLTEHV